jgi:hypothetical protein
MTDRPSRRQVLALTGAGLAALAGCTSNGGEDTGNAEQNGGDGSEPETETVDPKSATNEYGLPLREPTVPLDYELSTFEENAVNGGPGKDGIPSIDDPSFGDVSAGNEMLNPGDPVFGIELDGEIKAYPQHILALHEIVNDTVGGTNIAATYCPLTGTAIGFERGDVEFGVSGMLVNNNLIMYDRATDSWWPQILGTGVTSDLRGQSLVERRMVWTTWKRWRETHPDTTVLTEDTGYARNYDRDPYGSYNPRSGYYENDRNMFSNLNEDDRYQTKEVFIGARSGDGAVAVHKDHLRETHLVETTVGDVPYLATYDPAVDTGYVYRNPEGTSFGGSDGEYEGPDGSYSAADLPLNRVHAFDAMWFAWAAFYPNTVVVA